MFERVKTPTQASESDPTIAPMLYTPAQAAELLRVKESWLRRQAGQRKIQCTFLGKHLRFSDADLVAIARNGRRPARAHRNTPARRNRVKPST